MPARGETVSQRDGSCVVVSIRAAAVCFAESEGRVMRCLSMEVWAHS